MTIGVVLRPDRTQPNLVDDVIEQATELYETGVDQIWLAQQFDHDAISLAGLVGAAVPGLGVGTFVVPINPRHPLLVAAQAHGLKTADGLGMLLHQARPGFARWFGIEPAVTPELEALVLS